MQDQPQEPADGDGGGGANGAGRGGGGGGRGGKPSHTLQAVDRSQLRNALFEEYYVKQGVVSEAELGPMLETLRRPLPTTFRVNGSGRFADELRAKLESDFFSHFSRGPIFVSAAGFAGFCSGGGGGGVKGVCGGRASARKDTHYTTTANNDSQTLITNNHQQSRTTITDNNSSTARSSRPPAPWSGTPAASPGRWTSPAASSGSSPGWRRSTSS